MQMRSIGNKQKKVNKDILDVIRVGSYNWFVTINSNKTKAKKKKQKTRCEYKTSLLKDFIFLYIIFIVIFSFPSLRWVFKTSG